MLARSLILVLFLWCECFGKPYANDYPYKKYRYANDFITGGGHAESGSELDGSSFLKNNLRDQGGKLAAATDIGNFYNLENQMNGHSVNQLKKGSSTDNLKHVQGEDFETDKSHKRKHIKSGFSNSYHKDENGSKTSYYEDSDDKGGKVVYDKRHGTKGDQQENEFTEGVRNGILKDKYDDRRTEYDNRNLHDRHSSFAEDQGKKQGYYDRYKALMEQQLDDPTQYYQDPPERPYDRPDTLSNDYFRRDFRRPVPELNWQHFRSRVPMRRPNDFEDQSNNLNIRDRRITIYEDPRDDFVSRRVSPVDRMRDNYVARSEITRRFDYRPYTSTMNLRYRGHR